MPEDGSNKLPQSFGSHLPDQMTSHQEDRKLYLFVCKYLVVGNTDILLVLGESNAKSFITRQGNTPKKIYSVFHCLVPVLVGSHSGKCDFTKYEYMQGNAEDKTFIAQITVSFRGNTRVQLCLYSTSAL